MIFLPFDDIISDYMSVTGGGRENLTCKINLKFIFSPGFCVYFWWNLKLFMRGKFTYDEWKWKQNILHCYFNSNYRWNVRVYVSFPTSIKHVEFWGKAFAAFTPQCLLLPAFGLGLNSSVNFNSISVEYNGGSKEGEKQTIISCM